MRIKAYGVVMVNVADGQAVLLPDDIRFRVSHWGATVQDSHLPLCHLHITGLHDEVLLQHYNNTESGLLSHILQGRLIARVMNTLNCPRNKLISLLSVS